MVGQIQFEKTDLSQIETKPLKTYSDIIYKKMRTLYWDFLARIL